MQTSVSLDLPVPVAVVVPYVATLDRYPAWMQLVHRAEPSAGDPTDAEPPAWDVELRAHLGPLARSKRLRMVRTRAEDDGGIVVFERRELDGRAHSPWVLTVELDEAAGPPDGCRLTMHLSYGGSLWTGGVLQRVLDEEIRRGSARLLELVSEPTR
jgi:hypothetical protein